MLREPPDILITTPESLFLLLTSRARELLRSVDTLILDEVHAVAGTKRGAHLALSVERLEALAAQPPQRIGLSATQRPLEEIGRFVSGGRADRARRRRRREGARPRGRRPGRGHARAGGLARRGLRAALDLAVDLPGARRARPRAPLDDRLRQQPPSRRAARAAAERARGGRDRPRSPRLAGARAADADRGGPEGRPYPVPRRDLVARARDRHGRRRPRDPGRVAEVGRPRPAADRPRRPLARRGLARPHLPEVPRRPARVGGRRAADAGGADRGDADPAQPARRPRPAHRRHLRRRGDRGRRAARARAPRLSLRRPLARAARERPRHARRPLPVGRVRRAAAAHHLGSHRGRPPRAAGCASARRHERGHDPRPRPLRRLHRRRRAAEPRGRARRGDGLRGARRPGDRARRLLVADRGDHPRPRARLAGAGRAGRGAVLEGRGRRPAVRARRGDRQVRARAARGARPEGAGSRRTGRAEPTCLPPRAGEGDRRAPVRPHGRRRAVPRRDRRLAPLHPHALRCARARAVGDGRRRAAARVARPRGAVDLVGRRHRLPPARRRLAAGDRPARARSGRARGPRARRGGADGALRRPLPRERGPRASHPAPPPGRADAALAAAAQGAGAAPGRAQVLELPDRPRDVPRVPAGRVRPARR